MSLWSPVEKILKGGLEGAIAEATKPIEDAARRGAEKEVKDTMTTYALIGSAVAVIGLAAYAIGKKG